MPTDTAMASLRAVGGRATVDSNEMGPTGLAQSILVPPPTHEGYWDSLTLDARAIRRLHPFRLAEMLADSSPEVSKALWDSLRLLNNGYETQCFKPGTMTLDPAAEAAKDVFLGKLKEKHGSPDIVINKLFLGGFMRGAFFSELVMDGNGEEALDIATPDPASARFKRRHVPGRGTIWELGQLQGGRYVDLSDRPTVRYTPIDPFPASMYGRSIMQPAIFHSLFLLGLLHDIRRVVRQQGYPRLDLSLNIEAIRKTMPEDVRGDQKRFDEWVNRALADLQEAFDNLPPDASFAHTDVITVGRPVGAMDTSSLGSLDSLIKALERFLARALKMMPLVLGLAEGTSEANANRQWEIQAAGIKALQHPVESHLENALEWALRVEGIQASVKWRFAELRTAEKMRDAQTKKLEIENEYSLYALGLNTQEQMAEALVKHPPALPEPELIPAGWSVANAPQSPNVNPDPGSSKSRQRDIFQPAGDHDVLPAVPLGIEYDQRARDDLLEQWNEAMAEDWDGLLDARVRTEARARTNGKVHH